MTLDFSFRWIWTLLVTALLAFFGLNVAGCAGTGTDGAITLDDAAAFMQSSGFKGDFAYRSAGAPFSWNTGTWVGKHTFLDIQGEVDYTGATPLE